MRLLLILAAAVAYIAPAPAQSRAGGSCGPVGSPCAPAFLPVPALFDAPPAAPAVQSATAGACCGPECRCTPGQPVCEWWHLNGDPKEVWTLRVDGREAGKLDERTMRYTSPSGEKYDFCPVVKAESKARPPVEQVPPGGINREKFDGRERYIVNGQEVPAARAFEALGGAASDLTDDSGKPWLTVIGSDSARQQVLRDTVQNSALVPVAAHCRVKGYAPDHKSVKEFKASGAPTIVLQAPNGRVLWRQDSYDGPEPLAKSLQQVIADYDPAKDPGPGKPLPPKPAPQPDPAKPAPAPAPSDPNSNHGAIMGCCLAAVMLLLLVRGRQQPTN